MSSDPLLDSYVKIDSTNDVLSFYKCYNYYKHDKDSAFQKYYYQLFRSDSCEIKIANWLISNVNDSLINSFDANFLLGLGYALLKDTASSVKHFTNSKRYSSDSSKLEKTNYNLLVLNDSTDFVSGGISYSNPVTYSGSMLSHNNDWIPKKDNFEVLSGTYLTYFGNKYDAKAQFKDWTYIKDSETNSILSWAVLVTDGKIYMSNIAKMNEDQDTTSIIHNIKIRSNYNKLPLDFFNKYKLINLKKGDSFPVALIPFFKQANEEFLVFIAGDSFQAREVNFKQTHASINFFGGSSLGKEIDKASFYGRVYSLKSF